MFYVYLYVLLIYLRKVIEMPHSNWQRRRAGGLVVWRSLCCQLHRTIGDPSPIPMKLPMFAAWIRILDGDILIFEKNHQEPDPRISIN